MAPANPGAPQFRPGSPSRLLLTPCKCAVCLHKLLGEVDVFQNLVHYFWMQIQWGIFCLHPVVPPHSAMLSFAENTFRQSNGSLAGFRVLSRIASRYPPSIRNFGGAI